MNDLILDRMMEMWLNQDLLIAFTFSILLVQNIFLSKALKEIKESLNEKE